MNPENAQICDALLNRRLTHSAFRLYSVLAMALDGRQPDVPGLISVESLRGLMPGVRGKPFGNSALRQAVLELESQGLVKITGPRWSKVSIQVTLPRAESAEAAAAEKIKGLLPPVPGEHPSG